MKKKAATSITLDPWILAELHRRGLKVSEVTNLMLSVFLNDDYEIKPKEKPSVRGTTQAGAIRVRDSAENAPSDHEVGGTQEGVPDREFGSVLPSVESAVDLAIESLRD